MREKAQVAGSAVETEKEWERNVLRPSPPLQLPSDQLEGVNWQDEA